MPSDGMAAGGDAEMLMSQRALAELLMAAWTITAALMAIGAVETLVVEADSVLMGDCCLQCA